MKRWRIEGFAGGLCVAAVVVAPGTPVHAGNGEAAARTFAQAKLQRVGDYIRFEVPYGVFTYRTIRHYVVAENDVAVLNDRGREILRLQACHPRFFATHRYIVDAKLVAVSPRGASAYTLVRSAST